MNRSIKLAMVRSMFSLYEVTDEMGQTLAYPLDHDTGAFKKNAIDFTSEEQAHGVQAVGFYSLSIFNKGRDNEGE